MLLRRISKHVKDQNWFAVGIDFFIVVFGILIAFQITEWSDKRADRALRSVYLTQLTEDLKADVEEADDQEALAWNRVGAINDVFEAAGFEEPLREFYVEGRVLKAPPFPDFESDYPYAHNHIITNLTTFEETRETFDALVSNGHLDLLRDPELVREIQRYQRIVEGVQVFDSASNYVFQSLTEIRSRHGISNGGRTTLGDLAKAVQSDQQFAAQLESYLIYSATQSARSAELKFTAQALIDKIEEAR